MNNNQKILIASNRYIVAEGLGCILKGKGFQVIGGIESQDQLERTIVHEQPDVLIIDNFGSSYKVEKTIAFLSITSPAKMILIADTLKRATCELYLKVGINGIVTSEITNNELDDLLKAILKNHVYTDQKIKKVLAFDEKAVFKNTCAELNISEREVEIIKLIAEGFINKEIADRLFLSTHTVNTHRKNIMAKLGVSNASGVVLFAVKERLVSPKEFLFSSKR